MSELKGIVEDFWRAWCANDVATMKAAMAKDCVFDIVGGMVLDGRDEFLAGNQQFMDSAIRPAPKLTIETIVEEGPTVMCAGRGEMTGALTGAAYNNRYAWCFTFRDGLIERVVEYCDTNLLHEAIFGKTLS